MESQKRQNITIQGGLYLLPTPIGNLGDITVRVTQLMQQMDVICCEDTRKTLILFNALGLKHKAKLIRFDAHIEHSKLSSKLIGEIADYLKDGMRVALMTDAGTPCISDPGAGLVKGLTDLGYNVFSIPGASAVSTFIAGAGVESVSHWFKGFFPRSQAKLEAKSLTDHPHVFFIYFESPERIESTLGGLVDVSDLHVVLAKELTKVHETWFRGTIKEAFEWIQSHEKSEGKKGEWVLGLIRKQDIVSKNVVSENIEKSLELLIKFGISPKDASREMSQSFGISKNDLYDLAVSMQKKYKKS